MDFTASKTLRNKPLLFVIHIARDILLQKTKQTIQKASSEVTDHTDRVAVGGPSADVLLLLADE